MKTHLIVGGKHAHVQRHGSDHCGACPPEQPDRSIFLHDPHLRQSSALSALLKVVPVPGFFD